MRPFKLAWLVGSWMWLSVLSAHAQIQSLGLDLQSTTLIQAGGIRLMSMGGLSASLPDPANFRNPAAMVFARVTERDPFAILRPEPPYEDEVLGIHGWVDRDDGATRRLYSLTAQRREPEKAFLGLRYVALRSNRYGFTLPGPQNVLRKDEADLFLLGLGYRVAPRTSVGIVLVRGMTDVFLFTPTGAPTARVNIETSVGLDVSAYHQTPWGLRLGVLFMQRSVKENFQSFVGPSPPAGRFNIRFYRLGTSYDPLPSLTLAVEYGGARIRDNNANLKVHDNRWYFGGEYRLKNGLALRIGSFGEQFTAGLGYRAGSQWLLDYGYVADVNRKAAERIVGQPMPGSDTHFFSLRWLY